MSLPLLREKLNSLEYKQNSVMLVQPGEDWSVVLSDLAYAFICCATEFYNGSHLSWYDIYNRIWSDYPDITRFYFKLDREAKAEVLGFFTCLLHELTHHVDFMITPFGANYHTKACLEYIAFQSFIPEMFKHPELTLNGYLVDFDKILTNKFIKPDDEIILKWKPLYKKICVFDAFNGAKKDKITALGSKTQFITIFGTKLEFIKIHNFMYTVSIPGNPSLYVRPITILEARALIHSLQWILYLFNYDLKVKEDLIIFLEAFYSPQHIAPDYTFLLNLFASIWGYKDFVSFIQDVSIEILDSMLMVIDSLCWYALQAPPASSSNDSVFNSSPVARLIIIFKHFEKIYPQLTKEYPSAIELLDVIDNYLKNTDLGLWSIEKNLNFAHLIVKQTQEINRLENHNKIIQAHFDHILNVQSHQLQKRLLQGFSSELGIPKNGNPLFGIVDDFDGEHLLMEYLPHKQVSDWFTFREQLLFRFKAPSEIESQLKFYFLQNIA